MYIEWYIQTVQQITQTLIHKNQFTSLCRGQKPASKCIRLVYEMLVRCRALQALYTPQRCELMKTKTNNINCSYRIFIVCRSPVSPVFWAWILLTRATEILKSKSVRSTDDVIGTCVRQSQIVTKTNDSSFSSKSVSEIDCFLILCSLWIVELARSVYGWGKRQKRVCQSLTLNF